MSNTSSLRAIFLKSVKSSLKEESLSSKVSRGLDPEAFEDEYEEREKIKATKSPKGKKEKTVKEMKRTGEGTLEIQDDTDSNFLRDIGYTYEYSSQKPDRTDPGYVDFSIIEAWWEDTGEKLSEEEFEKYQETLEADIEQGAEDRDSSLREETGPFDIKRFLAENRLTTLGRLYEREEKRYNKFLDGPKQEEGQEETSGKPTVIDLYGFNEVKDQGVPEELAEIFTSNGLGFSGYAEKALSEAKIKLTEEVDSLSFIDLLEQYPDHISEENIVARVLYEGEYRDEDTAYDQKNGWWCWVENYNYNYAFLSEEDSRRYLAELQEWKSGKTGAVQG